MSVVGRKGGAVFKAKSAISNDYKNDIIASHKRALTRTHARRRKFGHGGVFFLCNCFWIRSESSAYRQLHRERRPVEQLDPALDDVPGAVDRQVRRRRAAPAAQAEIPESEITPLSISLTRSKTQMIPSPFSILGSD